MLIASSEVRVEKQGRFKLPLDLATRWKELGHGPEVVVTTLLDRRLLIYPHASFDALMAGVHLDPTASPEAVRTIHVLNRNGVLTTIDREDRLAIPPRVRRIVGERLAWTPPCDALLVGCNDHLELLFDSDPVALDYPSSASLSRFRIAPL